MSIAARASTFSVSPPSCMILRLRSLTASSLEARLDVGRGSPLKHRMKQFMCFSLVGVFLAEGEGVCWIPEAVALA